MLLGASERPFRSSFLGKIQDAESSAKRLGSREGGATSSKSPPGRKPITISTLPKRRLLSRFRAPSRPTFRHRIQAPVIQILGAAFAEDR